MNYTAEKIVPDPSTETSKGVQIEEMFNSIAPQYDLLNHTLSLGIDRSWRKKGILSLKEIHPRKILDIATGTGDLAIEAYNRLQPDQILGIDISEGMMSVGRTKTDQKNLSDKIKFKREDCMNLTFQDNSFDAAMVAFGIRNFEDLDKGLKEILRILRPGGKLMILELTTPEHFPMKQGYKIYSQIVIPLIGKLISGNKSAYTYLPKSISVFPQNKEMKKILEKNGFQEATYKKLSGGLCGLYTGKK